MLGQRMEGNPWHWTKANMVREMAQEAEGFKTAKEGEVRKWGSPLCSDAQWHQDSGPGKFNHFLTGLSPMIPFWVSGEAEPKPQGLAEA